MGFWRSCGGILCGLAIAGCSGHSLDIGSNDGGVAADSEVPSLPLGPGPDASSATTQVWTGHLVNHQFSDGSNALTMTIDFAPGGQVTGTILLGDGTLLAPPTDPNVGYPPGVTAVSLVEGFRYTILNGILQAPHLTLQFSEFEVWTQWCALQTPNLESAGDSGNPGAVDYWDCIPPAVHPAPNAAWWVGPTGCGYDAADGAMPIDCGKFFLCGGAGSVCQCAAAGCGVWDSGTPGVSLALDLANTKANGTLSGIFGDYPVQFTRGQ